MKREKAIFTASRLYRQASEGSHQLFQIYIADYPPFKEIIQILSNGGTLLEIRTLEQCKNYLSKTRKILERRCREISPYIAIPVLLQAVTDFYYGNQQKERMPWLGTSLKITLSLIWGNVHESEGNLKNSIKELSAIVKIAGLFEQLDNSMTILETFGEGIVEVRPDGIYPVDMNLRKSYFLFQETFKRRGLTFRTLGQIGPFIYENPFALANAIEDVLRGEPFKAQEYFKGTIFDTITQIAPDNFQFWTELWVRITMMIHTMGIRATVTQNPYGVTIFEDYPVISADGFGKANIQQYIKNIFWRRDWYKTRIAGSAFDMNNMIVERPVLRITNQQGIYATSSILIADSINWFIESSVLNYQGLGGIPLSNLVFKKHISAHFENQVCDSFRIHHFLAGLVNGKGTWITEQGNLPLVHNQKEPMPGEIDVLAFHPMTHELFIIECKVLAHPYGKSRLKNVVNKLGELDSEGFHSKLRKKIEWIKNTDIFSVYPVSQFVGLILTDQLMPTTRKDGFQVIDFENLDNALTKLYDNRTT
jgi:hypothetical protein